MCCRTGVFLHDGQGQADLADPASGVTPAAAQENIGAGEIAVQDVLGMQVAQGSTDLDGTLQDLLHVCRAALLM